VKWQRTGRHRAAVSDDAALPRRNPRVLCWRSALPGYARGSNPFARSKYLDSSKYLKYNDKNLRFLPV